MAVLTLLAGSREFTLNIADAPGAGLSGKLSESSFGHLSSSGQSLLQLIYLSGLFQPPPLCAGLSLCGRCQVRFLPESPVIPEALPEDVKALGQRAVEQGWRLGCRHKALLEMDGARLELPPGIKVLEAVENVSCETFGESSASTGPETSGPAAEAAMLAVDYGSTSLHYAPVSALLQGVAVNSPKIAVNPQIGAGSDIISRLAFALRDGGPERLRRLSQDALRRMLAETEKGGRKVKEICLAANPSMVYLLLGRDVSGLSTAPYRLDYRGGITENLPGLPSVWVAPLMGPFMGGDLSAGYAALACAGMPAKDTSGLPPLPGFSPQMQGHVVEYPFVLADMGTNGEFVLALDEHTALAASLPLGPALEGIGMSCGSEARPGVVTNFALTSDGLVPQMFGQSSPTRGLTAMPQGLSGTAYLSLASHLLRQGLVQPSGLFSPAFGPAPTPVSPPPSPLAARLGKALRDKGEGTAFYLSPSLYMTGEDVEELLKIKAAFTLALKLLLKSAGLKFADIKKLYLAGSLGIHTDVAALENLGFIPAGSAVKVLPAGNTSLAGAALLCLRPELRQPLVEWAASVKVLGLAEAPEFQSGYTEEMQFVW